MDGEVRVRGAATELGGVYSSHTLHRDRPARRGKKGIADPLPTRRERLIVAMVEAIADGSVDRLDRSLDTTKAQ
jgi:hypothetical protein